MVSTVRTPRALYEALLAVAKKERRSINATMLIAFERYVQEQQAQRGPAGGR